MPKVGLHVFPFWTAQLFVWTPHFGWTAPRRLNYTSLASCQSEQLMLFWQKSNSNSLVRRRDVTFDYLIYKMYPCTVLIKEFLSEIRTWRTTPAARLWWRLMMHLYHVRQMEMQSQSHVDRLRLRSQNITIYLLLIENLVKTTHKKLLTNWRHGVVKEIMFIFRWLLFTCGYTEIDIKVLFTLDGNDKGLRGHSKKICKVRFNIDVQKVFFFKSCYWQMEQSGSGHCRCT